jgi:tRNA nucleotidyltransferase (CCA-adding enzyme)
LFKNFFEDLNGVVYDFTGGVQDIEQRRIRFTGDPSQRIQQDYGQILRYFRFYGRIARESNEHTEETILAIRENKEGLKVRVET